MLSPVTVEILSKVEKQRNQEHIERNRLINQVERKPQSRTNLFKAVKRLIPRWGRRLPQKEHAH
jgi:hypothetical protein